MAFTNLLRLLSSLPCEEDTTDASLMFDKQTILSIHNAGYNQFAGFRRISPGVATFFTTCAADESGECSLPLEALHSILLTELQVGKHHAGRVLYGTLCVHAFQVSGIMTCLEDEAGNVARVSIYDSPCQSLKKAFPKGLKVAVKEPFFKVAADGLCVVRVDNPKNFVKLPADFKLRAPVDVEKMRSKGNQLFEMKDWKGAIACYTECITSAPSHLKLPSNEAVMLAYSNRAEAWMKVGEYEQALADCDKALEMDPNHLKSLYRKGRALHELKHYERACACLANALRKSPGSKEIATALEASKKCHSEMQDRDSSILSKFLRGKCNREVPKLDEYIGPVVIKKVRARRGLFVASDVKDGDLLVTSNAVAVIYQKTMNISARLDYRTKRVSRETQNELVSKVTEMAKSSAMLLHQLYNLPGSSFLKTENPTVGLFLHGNSILNGKEGMQFSAATIDQVVRQNAFSQQVSPFFTKDSPSELLYEEGNFGLWLLPSFINHSCLPNASRMEVGEAMFIHAACDMKAGTEITLPYFDVLLPLKQREEAMRSWGLKCNCKRCAFEKTLQIPLRPITKIFQDFHDRAAEEVMWELAEGRKDMLGCPSKDGIEFTHAGILLEKLMCLLGLGKEEADWLRASYSSAYLAGVQENVLEGWMMQAMIEEMEGVRVPGAREVMKAVEAAVPGHRRTLALVCVHLQMHKEVAEERDKIEENSIIEKDAMDVCIRTFGKQELPVLKDLIHHYGMATFFP